MERMSLMIATKKPSCPFCGSQNVSLILYGLQAYSEELERQLERKEVVIGGCMIHDEDAQWLCQDCKEEFGRRDHSYDA